MRRASQKGFAAPSNCVSAAAVISLATALRSTRRRLTSGFARGRPGQAAYAILITDEAHSRAANHPLAETTDARIQ
jgi:hypothetical protein